ncbi:hypothetical protein J2S46_000011 [Kitasatospora herbaricolor]|uniref:hypothetical protein n=1 Tax=Kitasatospora herbaricolor TaxID=68217 RepID=UPI00174DDC2D|nr:hypothetical protein [Kitasatospora herbaricolor]MDQ0305455.1 hypothetical protein [Kitasatospora herbaricolor]
MTPAPPFRPVSQPIDHDSQDELEVVTDQVREALAQAHLEVLDLVGYIDQDIIGWLAKASRLPQLLATRP